MSTLGSVESSDDFFGSIVAKVGSMPVAMQARLLLAIAGNAMLSLPRDSDVSLDPIVALARDLIEASFLPERKTTVDTEKQLEIAARLLSVPDVLKNADRVLVAAVMLYYHREATINARAIRAANDEYGGMPFPNITVAIQSTVAKGFLEQVEQADRDRGHSIFRVTPQGFRHFAKLATLVVQESST